jgi:4-carboxymuconolactone decarboxylase
VRAACAFAAAMSRRRQPEAARALRAMRATGAPRRLAEEVALMLMLYAGYPAAIEGLRVLHQAWPGRARGSDAGTPGRWRARGEALCRRVYGEAYARLLPAVETLHPDLATWMVEHGYGRVLARPGAGVRERELVTIAALAALGWERQLVSHVLGALRVGATRRAVEQALATGAGFAEVSGRAAAARTRQRLGRALAPARAAGPGAGRARAARRAPRAPRSGRPARR